MKYFYYVGIQVNDGLVFITSLNTKNKQFAYDCVKQPLLFSSQDDAIDIVENLCMNLVQAVVVTSPIEINRHFVSLDAIKEALLEEPKIKELGLSISQPANEEDRTVGCYSLVKHNFIETED